MSGWVAICRVCQRTLVEGETVWADDVKVIEPGGVRIEVRYTCDECAGVRGLSAGELTDAGRDEGPKPASWHHSCTCGIAAGWSLIAEHEPDCPFGRHLAGLLTTAHEQGRADLAAKVEACMFSLPPGDPTRESITAILAADSTPTEARS